jgi:lipid-A-disaccharide synthase
MTNPAARGQDLLMSAGEASSDAYGARLARELFARRPGLRVGGLGGPEMAAAGVELMQDTTRHAVMGAAGLLGGLGAFARAYRRMIHRLSCDPPAALVLIDSPEFNLPVARHARRVGVPVVYYVSPQVWAWRRGRIRKIAARVTKMLCLFEFERELYERAGVDVVHVGHPLVDVLGDKLGVSDRGAVRRSLGLPESGTVVGLLPGSRRKEIDHVLPVLLRSAEILRREAGEVTFVLARAPGLDPERIDRVAAGFDVPFRRITGRAHDVMLASDLLLICSGTATLEAGLLGTPMVVTYQADLVNTALFGALVKAGDFALANIAAGERIVPEFYLLRAKPDRIAAAARALLDGGLDAMRRRLGVLRETVGPPGATARAADEVLAFL